MGRGGSSSNGKKAIPSGTRRGEAKSTGNAVREPGRGRPGHPGLCRAGSKCGSKSPQGGLQPRL